MKATIAAIMIFVGTAFISGCSLGIAIITALNKEDSRSFEMKVESNPSGADVYLDGKKLGEAPITIKIVGLNLKHKIEITKNGYQSKIVTVFISPQNAENQEYVIVNKSEGTYIRVQGNILNVVLEKK
ncbi:MAG: PEGA domain-containing protein [Desulfobacterales bacterium]